MLIKWMKGMSMSGRQSWSFPNIDIDSVELFQSNEVNSFNFTGRPHTLFLFILHNDLKQSINNHYRIVVSM